MTPTAPFRGMPSLFDPDEPDELSIACHCTD
jgi:hypothetical protein